MASRNATTAVPVTFDLPLDLLAKIETCRQARGLATTSAVIRAALEHFDFAGCQPPHILHRQVSVRLTAEQRAALKRYAKIKAVSAGVLLRMAIEELPASNPKAATQSTKRRKR